MANKYGIPEIVENEIRRRDKTCAYCHKRMLYPYASHKPGNSATIEHFREKGPFYWDEDLKKEDLAICCGCCNASRGRKKLLAWFKTPYCLNGGINEKTVSLPVKKYINKNEKRKKN